MLIYSTICMSSPGNDCPKNLQKKLQPKKEAIKQKPFPLLPTKKIDTVRIRIPYAYVALYLTPPTPSRVSRNAVRRRPHLGTTGITVITPLGTVSATTS